MVAQAPFGRMQCRFAIHALIHIYWSSSIAFRKPLMQMTFVRSLFAGLLVSAAAVIAKPAVPGALAAELIMLERPGCSWCIRWNREIAPIYPLTEEGQRAPLRRVDVTRPWPEDLAGIATDRYTPTFIVVENGREVARLRGYPGDNFFWPLLEAMLAKLGPATEDENG